MARGLLSGFVLGATVSAAVVALASFVAGPPAPPEVSADVGEGGVAAPSSAELSGPIPARGEADAPIPDPPVVDMPEPDRQANIGGEAVRPAGRPEAGAPAARVVKPAPMGDTGGLSIDGDAPVAADRQATRPSAPRSDAPAAPLADRPSPPGSAISFSESGSGSMSGLTVPAAGDGDSPVMPDTDAQRLADRATPSAPGAPGQQDSPAVLVETAPRPVTDLAGSVEAQGTADAPAVPAPLALDPPARGPAATDRAAAPNLAEASQRENAPSTAGLPRNGERAGSDPAPGNFSLPQAGATGPAPERSAPAIGTPATSLLQRGGVRNVDPEAAEGEASAEDAATVEPDPDQPAIVQHAEAFDAPEGEPLLSIILMDTGQDLDASPIGMAALSRFPYALSFAVDTSLPDAEERAAEYRAAGYEVLALIDLPENLTAADTEVAMSASLARVPQAVGVLEGPGSGLQGNAEMAAQVAAILEDTGHGIVWQPSGLDTAQRLAARSGIPSHTLYRDFDSEDQTPLVIRRFLDHAAFRAGQEGSVVTVGRLRPDTISALLVWGLQDRAQRVAVAPISTTLLAERESG